jgi:hypothetical protein
MARQRLRHLFSVENYTIRGETHTGEVDEEYNHGFPLRQGEAHPFSPCCVTAVQRSGLVVVLSLVDDLLIDILVLLVDPLLCLVDSNLHHPPAFGVIH